MYYLLNIFMLYWSHLRKPIKPERRTCPHLNKCLPSPQMNSTSFYIKWLSWKATGNECGGKRWLWKYYDPTNVHVWLLKNNQPAKQGADSNDNNQTTSHCSKALGANPKYKQTQILKYTWMQHLNDKMWSKLQRNMSSTPSTNWYKKLFVP